MPRRLLHFAALSCVFVVSACSNQRPVDEQPAHRSTQPDEILRRLAGHMRTLRSFGVEMSMTMNAEGPGIRQQQDTRHRLLVRKPGRLALISLDGVVGWTVIYDGRQEYTHDPMTDASSTRTPPGAPGLDDYNLTYLAPAMPQEAIAISYIEALVSSEPFPKLHSGAEGLAYDGVETVDGIECHKLKVTLAEKGGWTLFVDTSDTPLLRRIEPDTSDVPEDMPGMKMDLTIVFSDWQLDPEIPDNRFRVPPEGQDS